MFAVPTSAKQSMLISSNAPDCFYYVPMGIVGLSGFKSKVELEQLLHDSAKVCCLHPDSF